LSFLTAAPSFKVNVAPLASVAPPIRATGPFGLQRIYRLRLVVEELREPRED